MGAADGAGPAAHGGRIRFPVVFWSLVAFSVLAISLGAAWLIEDRAMAGQGNSALAVPAPQEVHSPAPDFALQSLDGNQVRLSDLRGKVVLLNFWATWCPPCKAEMPQLERLYKEYGSQHDFVVVGVDVEEKETATRPFAQQLGLTFPLLPDGDGNVSYHGYSVRSLPTSLIIDRDGNVRFTWIGEQSRSSMLNMLERVW